MHMKIEINHPENISSPPPEIFQIPWTTQHHGNNPNPSRKHLKHFRKHLHPSKKFKSLPEKSQPPWKTPPPQNSITITETTLELNLNPFQKNPNPLCKILNPSWKNLNPLHPKNFFNPPLKCLNTPWKFHMQPPWKFVKATK